MKKMIIALFVSASLSAFAQDPQSPRTAATSGKASSSPLPYDVNDKYMGRKQEFLNQMIVKELPADFPVYRKEWGLKEYNAVVDSWFMQHPDVLQERAKQKVLLMKQHQGQ
ncbi:MAG: hypothetical protein ACJ77K_01880 [Bacteroidia bacterium]